MNKKAINAVISKKINDWVGSIKDEKLQKQVRKGVIVTGGCITSLLLNEEVNDFDLYFKDKETLKAVCQYYAGVFNEANQGKLNKPGKKLHAWVLDGEDVALWKDGKKDLSSFAYDYPDIPYKDVERSPQEYKRVSVMVYNTPPDRLKMIINSDGVAEDSDSKADAVEYDVPNYMEAMNDADNIPAETVETKEKYRPIFLSTNAITLSGKIQIVVRFYGAPDEIHKNYDFVHATNYWTENTGVVLNQPALEAILNKNLSYIGSKYPVCSLVRTRKFIKRGWHINAGQFVKIAFQISELDLKDIAALEDQLVGVDSVYFLNFINNLKNKKLEDPKFELTQDYLTTVIDKIFG